MIISKKQNKEIIMPTKLINQQDFLNQLKNWKNYQFNLFFYLIDKICFSNKLKKESWDNFKNGDLKIEIPTNLIFNKQQLKNYVYTLKNFEKTKQSLNQLTNLNFSVEQIINNLPKIIIYKIFPTLQFDLNSKEKIIFWFNKQLINQTDKLLNSYKIFNKQDLINFKITKQETRFRILLLRLRILQNDKENFNKNKLFFSIKDLYEILKVSKKMNFAEFNRSVFKPIIKKLQSTPYFKELEIKYETDKTKIKIIAVKFIIPNFNFVEYEKQKRIEKKLTNEILESPKENKYCKKCNNDNFVFCRTHFLTCVKCCSCSWH